MATGITTNYFLPYPLSTDPVRVAGDIEQLATRIDNILNEEIEDSAALMWTGGTFSNGLNTPTYNDSTGKMSMSLSQDLRSTASPQFVGLTLTGDIDVQGGDVTTNQTTFNLINTTATTLNIGGAATTLSLGAVSGTTTVNNSLTVMGDLTVEGNVTTLNTATLEVEDNIILLNRGVTSAPTLDAGLAVERGTSANVEIKWNETSDLWTLTNDGTNYHSVVRKHTGEVAGNATNTSFTITHNLGTREVQVQVYDSASPYDTVETDVERVSTSAVTIKFATAPALGTNYKVVVVG